MNGGFAMTVKEARRIWMEQNPVEDGRDHVTPFDQFFMVPPPATVLELQDEVAAFAEKAFGPDREDAAWKKLFEEIGETLKNPDDPSEWADVFIILLDLATMRGVDVATATRAKLDIIKDRVWVQTPTGTFQHVPGAVQAPPGPEYSALFEGGPLGMDGVLRLGGQPLQLYAPVGHEGVGIYKQTRIDHGLGRRLIHVYRWDPDYPEVF